MTTRSQQKRIVSTDIPYLQKQLLSVDTALLDYFNKELQLFAIENNKKVELKTTMGSAERFHMRKAQQSKTDDNKQTIFPVATIIRGDIAIPEDRFVYNNNRQNMIPVSKKLSVENNTKSTLEGEEIYEVISVSPPVAVDIDYTFNLQTKYMQTSNSIIEQIIVHHGKKDIVTSEGFTIRLMISSFADSSNNEDYSDENRIINHTASFVVSCMLSLNIKNNILNIKKGRTPQKIRFTEQIIN